jgi:hypothetical protein
MGRPSRARLVRGAVMNHAVEPTLHERHSPIGRHELLNLDLVDWNAHFATAYARRAAEPAPNPTLTCFS